ncbi:competence type IV pilus minor pilin ComGD [Enterococcus villorum]|uniref:Competence protein ComYD n=2 Tax=Enterococcus villorum TaxID=112904 RepID=A0A511J3V8_9ENTE|nr:competence type IV pilus minor pilin ComGD [Enterococcus villorum]EOH92622.1 hypothetical protein UAO_00313 [Enterococcus villorum ATCC 700913]EOW75530.1 hypothetical protein I591_02623 [Enterococcus villorum ATCC 700913]GEL92680.1 competence protein ComYD [Enterococcus villorum]
MLITRNRTFFYSYTLIETVFVLVVTLGMFIFPVFSVASWQKQMAIEQFFTQFEHRIYVTQKIAIVNQQTTTIAYDPNLNQMIFNIPKTMIDWAILKVPKEIEVKKKEKISFAAYTGNESSLKAYEFYWNEKKQTIIYQFQMGSGHYIKKIKQE